MAMLEVLHTYQNALKDPTTGLASRAAAIRDAVQAQLSPGSDAGIRLDFQFGKWALVGQMHEGGRPQIIVRPSDSSDESNATTGGTRDAMHRIECVYQCFAASPALVQDSMTVVAAAWNDVMDGLRDYSDQYGGTVVQVLEGSRGVRFGEFDSDQSFTSGGFVAGATIHERSTV